MNARFCFRAAAFAAVLASTAKSFAILIALFLGTNCANAQQTLIELPEPETGPLPGKVFAESAYHAVEFSLSQPFSDVTIEASIVGFSGDTGTAYLTTANGPGATIDDLVASAQFDLLDLGVLEVPGNIYVEIFSGLTLPPGDYTLAFGAPLSVFGFGSFSVNEAEDYITHPAVSVGDTLFSANIDASFPPASDWSVFEQVNHYIRVTAIPEPGSVGLFGLGLAALAGLFRRPRAQVPEPPTAPADQSHRTTNDQHPTTDD